MFIKTKAIKSEYHDIIPNWGNTEFSSWPFITQLVELLLPTAESIAKLEGDKYVTQSKILTHIIFLETTIEKKFTN